jgi:hypothetical protein
MKLITLYIEELDKQIHLDKPEVGSNIHVIMFMHGIHVVSLCYMYIAYLRPKMGQHKDHQQARLRNFPKICLKI